MGSSSIQYGSSISCLTPHRGPYNYHIKFEVPKGAAQPHPNPIPNVNDEPSQQKVLTAQATTDTTMAAMHPPHDGVRLPHRSMSVGDVPPTVSRSHYVPK